MTWNPGDTRRMKVLVRCADGSIDGHRAYPIALRHRDDAQIVVAATEGEGFVRGRFYLVENLVADHHPYIVGEVREIPHESGWSLIEERIDERAGHEDFLGSDMEKPS